MLRFRYASTPIRWSSWRGLPINQKRDVCRGSLSPEGVELGRLGPFRGVIVWMALCTAMHAQQYVFRAYGQAEGLKNVSVVALAMDRSGFLWVATQNGVYRFLGAGFERFGAEQGIAEQEAVDIVADPNGTVWVGTGENLYRWDGQRFLPAGRNPIP